MAGSFLFGGMEVRTSHIVKPIRVPVRKHKLRRNQKRSYHARIQKKWNKRFGTFMSAQAIVMNGVIFVHPQDFDRVCQAIRKGV